MSSNSHPETLLPRDLVLDAAMDLLFALAAWPGVTLAEAARTLEAGAKEVQSGSSRRPFRSPGAFLARTMIAFRQHCNPEGLLEEQARRTASTVLNGQVTLLVRRSEEGLDFSYVPADPKPGIEPPLIRVRPIGPGTAEVQMLHPDAAPTSIGFPALAQASCD